MQSAHASSLNTRPPSSRFKAPPSPPRHSTAMGSRARYKTSEAIERWLYNPFPTTHKLRSYVVFPQGQAGTGTASTHPVSSRRHGPRRKSCSEIELGNVENALESSQVNDTSSAEGTYTHAHTSRNGLRQSDDSLCNTLATVTAFRIIPRGICSF